MSNDIRFDDLAKPVLNEVQKALLDSTRELEVDLSTWNSCRY